MMKEFSGFDRQPLNDEPLKKRRELLETGFDTTNFLDENLLRNEDGSLNQEALSVEGNALASVIIENMWQNLREQPNTYFQPEDQQLPITENFWQEFADHYIDITQAEKERTFDRTRTSLTTEDSEPSQADLAAARYMHVKKLELGQVGLPSFIDFISIYTRLTRAAEEAHIVEMGTPPTREAYEQILKNGSLQRMMSEMMLNSRDAGIFLNSLLEGNGTMGNTDDTSRSYKATYFTFTGSTEDGSFALAPKPEIFAKLKPLITKAVEKHRTAGSPTAINRCPVMYTGLFTEMCEWMNHEFTHHYLNQKYPVGIDESIPD